MGHTQKTFWQRGLDGDRTIKGLHAFILDIANGRLNTPTLRPMLTTLRGIALDKGNGDVRPVGIGELFTSIACALAVRGKDVTTRVASGVGPTDLMHGIPGGTEACAHTVRAVLSMHPGWVACKTDVKNAFNAVDRGWVLAAARHYPTLVPLANMLYGQATKVVYTKDKVTCTIDATMGVTQGDPLAALLYSTVLRPAVEATLAAHKDVIIVGIADDRIILGPPDAAFTALKTYKGELAKSAQTVQLGKTVVYKPNAESEIAAACDMHGVKHANGILVAGAPVGDDAFCHQFVVDYFANIKAQALTAIMDLYRSTDKCATGTTVSRQDVYRIVRSCVSPAAVNFLLRTTPSKYTLPYAGGFEAAVRELFYRVIDADAERVSGAAQETAKLILKLAAREGGLGLGDITTTATTAYVGSVALTAHIVGRFLREAACAAAPFDAARDAPRLFPELAAAFADGSLAKIKAYEDGTIANVFDAPVPRVQRALSAQASRLSHASILERIAHGDDKAYFLSGGDEGARWLTTTGSFTSRSLTDTEFSILCKARLGLAVVDECDGHTPCPRCSRMDDPEPQLIGVTGTHVLACSEGGNGNAKGQRNMRHTLVKIALLHALQETARHGYKIKLNEPVVSDFFMPKPDRPHADKPLLPSENRADIQVEMGGRVILIDTVVAHPTIRSKPTAAKTPGIAAAVAHDAKCTKYSSRFDLPVGSLVPFAIETGGRWHQGARDFVKQWVKWGLSSADGTPPDMSDPQTRFTYVARVSRIRASVSLALAIGVVHTLKHAVTHLTRPATASPNPSPSDNVSDDDEAGGSR